MILPSKHISQNRALLTIGAKILQQLSRPVTISALWEQMSRSPRERTEPPVLRYRTFVLALDLLFMMNAIELREGLVIRSSASMT